MFQLNKKTISPGLYKTSFRLLLTDFIINSRVFYSAFPASFNTCSILIDISLALSCYRCSREEVGGVDLIKKINLLLRLKDI